MTGINNLSEMFPIEKSEYYAFYLREREEILKHKWVLSERNHGEVSYSYAQWHWICNHRSDWLAALKASGDIGKI